MFNLALSRTHRRWLAALALVATTLTLGSGAARAQSECVIGGGMEVSVDFGLYNGAEKDASSLNTLKIHCKVGSQDTRIYVCVGLGAGSEGITVTNRRIKNETGANLAYQLYSDEAHLKMFETISSSTPTSQQHIRVLTANSAGNIDTGIRIYGRIPAQTITEAGTYTSTFSGPDFDVRWTQSASNILQLVDCKSLQTMSGGTFAKVAAQVEAKCELGVAQHVNFGEIDYVPLLPLQTAKGAVRVRCAPKATYRIEMGDGLYPVNAGTANVRRYMRHATDTSKTLGYYLYKTEPVSPSQRWGRIANNQHLTATGSNTVHTVYAQTATGSVIAGTYQDTVVVTLNY